MLVNKKLNPIVTELFIRGKKLNISLVFITQSYFAVSLIEKPQKYQHYQLGKLINMSILQVKKYYRLIKEK